MKFINYRLKPGFDKTASNITRCRSPGSIFIDFGLDFRSPGVIFESLGDDIDLEFPIGKVYFDNDGIPEIQKKGVYIISEIISIPMLKHT